MGGILAFDKGGVDSFETKLIDAVTVNLILSCLRQSSPNDKDQTLYVSRQQESIITTGQGGPGMLKIARGR